MEENETVCPICGEVIKKGNGHHIKRCIEKYVNDLSMERKQEIIDLYNSGYSMVDMSNTLGFGYSLTEKILKKLGLERRSVKSATNLTRCREKYENSCIERFGAPHNFSRESSSRKAWEQKMFETEGITNVFQREDVKDKIRKTMLEKYGEDGIFENRRKGNFVEYYIEKYGEEKGKRYFDWVRYKKGEINNRDYYKEKYGDLWEEKWKERLDKVSKCFVHNCGLNDKCEDVLLKYNFDYEREFKLISEKCNYFYDFRIGNLIIELYGIYWHCTPKKYKPNDLVKFPNNKFIKAQDKWNSDNEKNKFAESKGYVVIVIWEDEFNEDFLLNILKNYSDEVNKD